MAIVEAIRDIMPQVVSIALILGTPILAIVKPKKTKSDSKSGQLPLEFQEQPPQPQVPARTLKDIKQDAAERSSEFFRWGDVDHIVKKK